MVAALEESVLGGIAIAICFSASSGWAGGATTDRNQTMPVHELQHPLFDDRLAVLRDLHTTALEFRTAVDQISGYLAYEFAASLPTQIQRVQSPLAAADCRVLDRQSVVVAPILRAGLGLVPGVQRVFPAAPVFHLGIYRNESTLEPVVYYRRKCKNFHGCTLVLLDPMLATGGTLSAAIELLLGEEPLRVAVLCMIASRQGIDLLAERFPRVDIYAGAVDPELNERGFIVPGLGDAGDRMFGTDT